MKHASTVKPLQSFLCVGIMSRLGLLNVQADMTSSGLKLFFNKNKSHRISYGVVFCGGHHGENFAIGKGATTCVLWSIPLNFNYN